MIQLHIPPRVLTSQTLHRKCDDQQHLILIDHDRAGQRKNTRGKVKVLLLHCILIHYFILYLLLFSDPPPLQGVKFKFFNTFLMFLYPYSMKPCVQSKDIFIYLFNHLLNQQRILQIFLNISCRIQG